MVGIETALRADTAAARARAVTRDALADAVRRAVDAGVPIRQAARAAEVSRETVYSWLKPRT